MKCCSDSAAFSSPFAACSRPSSNRKSARACSSPPAFSSSLESATKRAWLPSWSQPVDALKSAIFAHGEGERAICSKSAEALLKRLARYSPGQIRNRFGSAAAARDETTAHRPKSQSPHRSVYLRLRIVQTRAKQGKSPETLRRCGEDR